MMQMIKKIARQPIGKWNHGYCSLRSAHPWKVTTKTLKKQLYEIFKLKNFARWQQGDNKSYQINKLKKFKLYEIFKFKFFTEREPPHPLLPDQKIKSQEN